MNKWTVRDSAFFKGNAIYNGDTWITTFAESEAAQQNAAYLVECANIRESLKDPAVVYANVIRGEIANPKQSEISSLSAINAELVEALQLIDQAENGPWDGAEQDQHLAFAWNKARAALAKAGA